MNALIKNGSVEKIAAGAALGGILGYGETGYKYDIQYPDRETWNKKNPFHPFSNRFGDDGTFTWMDADRFAKMRSNKMKEGAIGGAIAGTMAAGIYAMFTKNPQDDRRLAVNPTHMPHPHIAGIGIGGGLAAPAA